MNRAPAHKRVGRRISCPLIYQARQSFTHGDFNILYVPLELWPNTTAIKVSKTSKEPISHFTEHAVTTRNNRNAPQITARSKYTPGVDWRGANTELWPQYKGEAIARPAKRSNPVVMFPIVNSSIIVSDDVGLKEYAIRVLGTMNGQ